jgi:competence protein CoiA
MLIAFNEKKERVGATPGASGICQVCGGEVIPKCGAIKDWHWAHKSLAECDSFSDGETEWHRRMKSKFPESMREVVIIKDGVKHRADILYNGVTIEFQNSSISVEDILAREEFYGNMIWVLNYNGKEDLIDIRRRTSFNVDKPGSTIYYTVHWKHMKKTFFNSNKPIYLQGEFITDGVRTPLVRVRSLSENGKGYCTPVEKSIDEFKKVAYMYNEGTKMGYSFGENRKSNVNRADTEETTQSKQLTPNSPVDAFIKKYGIVEGEIKLIGEGLILYTGNIMFKPGEKTIELWNMSKSDERFNASLYVNYTKEGYKPQMFYMVNLKGMKVKVQSDKNKKEIGQMAPIVGTLKANYIHFYFQK